MELCTFVEPQQGATYDDQLAIAARSQNLGFTGFFRSDHYLVMGDTPGRPGPTDSWVTLAGLARETERIRLGTLVTSGTFRLPGLLAIKVAQVDQMSGGRVELGIGTGWFEFEHAAYGIPFPSLSERFDRLEEQLEIITGLWRHPADESYTYHGDFWTLEDSPALPKPVQSPHPPIVLGGAGPKRTPALAARFADELNVPFFPLAGFEYTKRVADEACEKIGRDPADLRRSVALVTCIGETEPEFEGRAWAIGREPSELRENGLAGLPEEAASKLAAYDAAGAERVYLQLLDMRDLDHVELIAQAFASVAGR